MWKISLILKHQIWIVDMKFAAFEPIDLKNKFELCDLSLDQVFPDPNQPRKNFTEESLIELSDSIKQYGVVQPIIVREISSQKYLIIAGERRWRASHLANLKVIPAIIKSDKHEDDSAISLVENIQREELNPIELAEAYLKLSKDHNLSHDEISKIVGKSRAAITNTMRLLNLSENVKKYLVDGELEAGHARSLLTLSHEKQDEIAQKIILESLTVRDSEQAIRNLQQNNGSDIKSKNPFISQAKNLEFELSILFNSKAAVKVNNSGAGHFSIHFSSIEKVKLFIEKMKEIEEV